MIKIEKLRGFKENYVILRKLYGNFKDKNANKVYYGLRMKVSKNIHPVKLTRYDHFKISAYL